MALDAGPFDRVAMLVIMTSTSRLCNSVNNVISLHIELSRYTMMKEIAG